MLDFSFSEFYTFVISVLGMILAYRSKRHKSKHSDTDKK